MPILTKQPRASFLKMGRCTNFSILCLESRISSRSSCVSTYFTFFLLDMRSVSDSSDCGLRLRELAELELLELLDLKRMKWSSVIDKEIKMWAILRQGRIFSYKEVHLLR